MIAMTPRALERVRAMQQDMPGVHGQALRVRVDAGGCSGLTYGFTFDEPREEDASFDQCGVTVLIDAQSLPFLTGATIDYVEDFQQSGFVVQNPNSTASCGCGKSFGV